MFFKKKKKPTKEDLEMIETLSKDLENFEVIASFTSLIGEDFYDSLVYIGRQFLVWYVMKYQEIMMPLQLDNSANVLKMQNECLKHLEECEKEKKITHRMKTWMVNDIKYAQETGKTQLNYSRRIFLMMYNCLFSPVDIEKFCLIDRERLEEIVNGETPTDDEVERLIIGLKLDRKEFLNPFVEIRTFRKDSLLRKTMGDKDAKEHDEKALFEADILRFFEGYNGISLFEGDTFEKWEKDALSFHNEKFKTYFC